MYTSIAAVVFMSAVFATSALRFQPIDWRPLSIGNKRNAQTDLDPETMFGMYQKMISAPEYVEVSVHCKNEERLFRLSVGHYVEGSIVWDPRQDQWTKGYQLAEGLQFLSHLGIPMGLQNEMHHHHHQCIDSSVLFLTHRRPINYHAAKRRLWPQLPPAPAIADSFEVVAEENSQNAGPLDKKNDRHRRTYKNCFLSPVQCVMKGRA